MQNITGKKMTKLSAVAIAIGLTISANAQSQEVETGISFQGQINSVVPAINVTVSDSPTAFVESINVAVNESGANCDFIYNIDGVSHSYQAGKKTVCVFDWGVDLKGLTPNALVAQGVVNAAGSVELPYTLSIINEGIKEEFYNGIYTLDMEAPAQPELVSFETNLDSVVNGLKEVETFNKQEGIKEVTIYVSPRSYDQKITFKGNTCNVLEGNSSCDLEFDEYVPGLEADALTGAEIIDIQVADHFEYLTPTSDSLLVKYDYRPPIITDFITSDSTEETFDLRVGNEVFKADPNLAYIIVDTPHINREDDWWKPEFNAVSFVPKNDVLSDDVTVNGITFEASKIAQFRKDSYEFVPNGYEVVGGKLLYSFVTGQMPDGIYDINFDVTDSYNNASDFSDYDRVFDRKGPEILAQIGQFELRESSNPNLQFLNDVYFFAGGGWEDGSKISDITIAGQSTAFEDLGSGVVRLGDRSDLTKGESYSLNIKAVDDNGNETLQAYDFVYMNNRINASSRQQNAFAKIQEYTLQLREGGQRTCVFSSSAEEAISVSNEFIKGCTVEFTNIPSSTDVITTSSSLILNSVFQESGEVGLGYVVSIFNQDGESKLLDEGVANIDVLEPVPIEIGLGELNKVTDDLYAVSVDGSILTDSNISYSSGDVELKMTSLLANNDINIRASNRAANRDLKYRIKKDRSVTPPLWERVPFNMSAAYSLDPVSEQSVDFNAVITPSIRTMAYLFHEPIGEATVNSRDSISLQAYIGTYSRRDDAVIYSEETMGRWEVAVAAFVEGEYVEISEYSEIDDQGMVTFNIEGERLFNNGRNFYAVARPITDIEGIDISLESRAAQIVVLKGEAIDGEINTRAVAGKVPFSTSLVFSHNTNDDRDASVNEEWQRSVDGVNWESITDEEFEFRQVVSVKDVSKTQYRVKMENVSTSEISYSDAVEITGFDIDGVELEGDTFVYAGMNVSYTANVSDENEGTGTYEWSLDRGKTWVEGEKTFAIEAQERFEIAVRYTAEEYYDIREVAGTVDSLRVSVIPPTQLQLSSNTDRYFETGEEGTVGGVYVTRRVPASAKVIEQITLPNNDVVEAGQIQFIPVVTDASNLSFKYEAWIEGMKDETFASIDINAPHYRYEFNTPTVDIKQYFATAPTPVLATVYKNYDNEAPDHEITYNYNVVDSENATLTRASRNRGYFEVTEEGYTTFEIEVRDNKGNEASITKVVEVKEKVELEIDTTRRQSKKLVTAPIFFSYRIDVDLEHPKDFINSIKWYKNGELVSERVSTSQSVEFQEPGTYEIRAVIESEYGQEGEFVDTIEINPNIPPVCSLNVEDEGETIYISTSCRDEDGKIVNYSYQIGDKSWSVGSRARFAKDNEFGDTVQITVTDNGGETWVESVNL